MAIIWQDVVDIAPELASLKEPTQTAILSAVAQQVSADTWGALADTGSTYLAAHLGTLTRRRGEAPTSQQAAGQVSRSYQNMLQLAGLYSTTMYGVEYSRMCRTLPTVLGFVGGSSV